MNVFSSRWYDLFRVSQYGSLSESIPTNSWKEVASIWIDAASSNLSRKESLLAAQEGRLAFSGIQYHWLTMGKNNTCDHWGKDKP